MPVWSFLYFRAWAMPNTYFWEFFLQNTRLLISRTLILVGAPAGGNRSDLFREKDYAKIDEKKMSEDTANTTQAMCIFSVLIATVTFASAFTLPGGYYQSASDGYNGAHAFISCEHTLRRLSSYAPVRLF